MENFFIRKKALDLRFFSCIAFAWTIVCEEQVNYFSNSFTCISVDLRGFGKSSHPTSTPYSFHADINILLDSLHIEEPIVLIALSMGGKAAVNFSLVYPDKTKALILADVAIDGYSFEEFNLKPIYDAGMQKGIDTANQLFLDHPIFRLPKVIVRFLGVYEI